MLLFLALSALLALVTCQRTPCCMDSQWSATMTDVTQFAKGNKVISKFYYDSTNKAIALRNFRLEYGGRDVTFLNRIITLYSQKVRYNIQADNTCTKQDIAETFLPRCIPDTSVYLGSSYVGPEVAGLKYDGWQVPLGAVNLTFAVSSPGCVPVMQGVSGTVTSGPIDLALFYNQYSVGISDPSVFHIPAAC